MINGEYRPKGATQFYAFEWDGRLTLENLLICKQTFTHFSFEQDQDIGQYTLKVLNDFNKGSDLLEIQWTVRPGQVFVIDDGDFDNSYVMLKAAFLEQFEEV